ncbi:MAG: ArsR/SmtB family transcription factor [Elusimicrobiota bacterium]
MNTLKEHRKLAFIFKAFAHPARIMIVKRLLMKELCVGDVKNELKLRQANVSQHLNILRNAGIVDYKKEGKRRCYFIVRPLEAEEMFKCIERRLK